MTTADASPSAGSVTGAMTVTTTQTKTQKDVVSVHLPLRVHALCLYPAEFINVLLFHYLCKCAFSAKSEFHQSFVNGFLLISGNTFKF